MWKLTFKTMLGIAILGMAACAQAGQKFCTYIHLSKKYYFQTSYTRASTVNLKIIRKSDKKVLQTISFPMEKAAHLPQGCSSRSYTTGYHQHDAAKDGNYGQVVVADLNFDGKDDVAVATEFTNGYGQLYKYYFQDKDGKFVDNTNFLGLDADKSSFVFPVRINSKNKTLTFATHAGVAKTVERTFQYNNKTKKWKKISKV